jgi:hypothetical protein
MKDTNIWENFKKLLEGSSSVHQLIIDNLKRHSLDSIPQDQRCKYSREAVIRLMVMYKFLGLDSVRSFIHSDIGRLLEIGKDVLYKVKNNPNMPWRRLLLHQAWQSYQGITCEANNSRDVTHIPCFIIDDTDIPKRGKTIELIGKIFSHVSNKYTLGFKSMNLAFWSGKHLLHLDFSYHIEAGKKGNQGMSKKQRQARYSKQRDNSSSGFKRRQEAFMKKTRIIVQMLKNAVKKGFEAQYVLADSWFFNSTLAQTVRSLDLHLVSRPKFNNWKYDYAGKKYTVGGLIKVKRKSKEIKYNRHLRLKFIVLPVLFKGVSYQIIYFKERKRGTKWQAIITTDKELSAQRAYKIYQTRWAIESGYKELKQLLSYGKCQSQDLDAQIADATHCLMVFNMLSQLKAIHAYETIGGLFSEVSKQWIKPTIMQRFWKHLYQAIKDLAELINEDVDCLIHNIIKSSNFIKKSCAIYNKVLKLTAET